MANFLFIGTKYQSNTKLALFTFALAFVVIMLGAYTRLTNAGLSCPDWPNCYGYFTAPHTYMQLQGAAQLYPQTPVDVKKAWTEMTHRYFAGTEGILILILSLSLLFRRKTKEVKPILIAIALIGLLCAQVLLGMLTVTEKLKPVIVLSHLLTGVCLLSVLWWAYLELRLRDAFVNRMRVGCMSWLWGALFIIGAQITLGGWVSTHYAGLACIDFPYCNGKLLPTMQWHQLNTDLITIHMLHRIGALFTAIYFSFLAIFLYLHPAFKTYAKILLTLVVLQITLGILNIIWLRPVWLALMHQSAGILLLLTIIACLVKAAFISDRIYGTWST